MDAFYASVEQRDDAALRGKPVIVGGIGKRGVVAAASYEARRFGVRSAMPTATARDLCPSGVFLKPRMSHYAALSAAIRDIFYRYTPIVEPLSLDEAYLDIGASIRLFGSKRAIGEGIRRDVRAELDLVVSVGIGPGKLIAKIASTRAKPDGMLVVEPDDAREFLRPLSVSEIWGVGRVTEQRLLEMHITRIGELADRDPDELERALGAWGPVLHALANGDDLRTVECDRGRSSYGEENTFPEDVVEREEIEAMVIAHAETVARRLRRDGIQGRTITLKYRPSTRTSEFKLVTRSETLAAPTDDGAVISRVAMKLWEREPPGMPLRLVGVQVAGLNKDRPVQIGLFDAPEDERRNALNAALDDIVAKFGPGAVKRGAT